MSTQVSRLYSAIVQQASTLKENENIYNMYEAQTFETVKLVLFQLIGKSITTMCLGRVVLHL